MHGRVHAAPPASPAARDSTRHPLRSDPGFQVDGAGLSVKMWGMRKFHVHETRTNRHADLGRRVKPGDDTSLDALLAAGGKPLFLVLDGIKDPHNLGACFRTADGAGVAAVVAPKDNSSPLNETARKIACGGAESVPCIFVTNLARALDKMKDAGMRVVGTSDAATASIYAADLRGPLAIVLGSEESGMRRLTSEKCDQLVRIPMRGKVACLNVSVSAGVCLYEAVRQRG